MQEDAARRFAEVKRFARRVGAYLTAPGSMRTARRVGAYLTAPGSMRTARRVGVYLAAPGSMLIVFLVGVAMVGLPLVPSGVTWSTGPFVRPIGEPVRIEIPSLRAKAEVDPIVLTGDVLRPPASPRRVGWWTGSAEPGSPTGQTLMTGHATHAGYSPLNRLRFIRRGATISVWSDDRKATYLVKDVVIWSKREIAQKADVLFDPDYHDRRLLLVTSAGYDGRKWNANVLVFAYPI